MDKFGYTQKDLIGEGSFGRVYKALEISTRKTVAVKVIAKRSRSKREIDNFRDEYNVQKDLSHPNIIQILSSFETPDDIVIVTEYAQSDLHKLLRREHSIPEDRARRLTHHLVSALYYLHSRRILHRDLKPQNILLDRDERAKLCDFGLARNMTMGTHLLTSIKGTPLYMAPELMMGNPYDHLADLWSLGCIIYETMAGEPPFSALSLTHLVNLIKNENEYVKWPTFLSSECISFLQGLLEKNPTNRLPWTLILRQPFVHGHITILDEPLAPAPFTRPLSESQCLAKERQLNSLTKMSTRLQATPPILQAAPPSCSFPPSHRPNPSDLLTSSRDSVNAILQSDIENLETDAEDACSILAGGDHANNPYPSTAIRGGDQPDQTDNHLCFVSGNSNLIITNFNDNFQVAGEVPSQSRVWHSRNKELEKRKLSQNLENFSVRLGGTPKRSASVRGSLGTGQQQKADGEAKATGCENKATKESSSKENNPGTPNGGSPGHQEPTASHSCSDTSGGKEKSAAPSLRPGWDSCDEYKNPPIENEEWMAFLQRSMQEVLEGEMDSLKQQNLVSIIVAPLRNSKASASVIECVAQLLSLPMVIDVSAKDMQLIHCVYLQVKLVPNLVYASKLLCTARNDDSCDESPSPTKADATKSKQNYKHANQLTMDERKTLLSLYELICHLVHLNAQYLTQFCDAVDILGAGELLANLMVIVSQDGIAIRLTNCILALLCFALREQPENAEPVVEKVMFHSNVSLAALLTHRNDMLKTRMCRMLRMLGRFSCCSLQKVWTPAMNIALEALLNDPIEQIRCETQRVVAEFEHLSFYKPIGEE